MRAVLKLEMIGDDFFWYKSRNLTDWDHEFAYLKKLGVDKSASWIARIHPGMCREFLQGNRDYSQANASGSRGIFEYYPLTNGVYEVNSRYEWRKVRRYFVLVESENITEISREEAEKWLNQNTKNI